MHCTFLCDAYCVSKNIQAKSNACTCLTSSHRIAYEHAKIKHAFRFLRVWPGVLSTRHTWRAIVLPDVYTRNCFSESVDSRFGGPGQKALPAMNEFTLFVDFCLSLYSRPVPLTYQPRNCKDGFISIVTRPLISLRYAICSTGRWLIIGRCVGACQLSSCAEERRP